MLPAAIVIDFTILLLQLTPGYDGDMPRNTIDRIVVALVGLFAAGVLVCLWRTVARMLQIPAPG